MDVQEPAPKNNDPVVIPYVGVTGNNANVAGSRKGAQDQIPKTSRTMPPSTAGKTKRRCPYCSFSSYYSASLTVHLRRHTGEKPYQCIYCHKVFGDRSNMNSHVRRYHRDGKTRKVSSSLSTTVQPPFLSESLQLASLTTSSDIPAIASVYSKDIPRSSSYVTVSSPISFASKLRSISTDSFPTMVSAGSSGQTCDVSLLKVNRRKPTVVRKQIPSEYLPPNDNIFTAQEENLFTRLNSESQSDEENLHAFHTADQVGDESFTKGEKHEEDTHPPFESSSDSRVSDEETKNGNQNVICTLAGMDDLYTCNHCNIFFKSCVLHTLHKGCHAHDDPFKCNFCGAKCKDAIEFHCHFARGNHNGEL